MLKLLDLPDHLLARILAFSRQQSNSSSVQGLDDMCSMLLDEQRAAEAGLAFIHSRRAVTNQTVATEVAELAEEDADLQQSPMKTDGHSGWKPINTSDSQQLVSSVSGASVILGKHTGEGADEFVLLAMTCQRLLALAVIVAGAKSHLKSTLAEYKEMYWRQVKLRQKRRLQSQSSLGSHGIIRSNSASSFDLDTDNIFKQNDLNRKIVQQYSPPSTMQKMHNLFSSPKLVINKDEESKVMKRGILRCSVISIAKARQENMWQTIGRDFVRKDSTSIAEEMEVIEDIARAHSASSSAQQSADSTYKADTEHHSEDTTMDSINSATGVFAVSKAVSKLRSALRSGAVEGQKLMQQSTEQFGKVYNISSQPNSLANALSDCTYGAVLNLRPGRYDIEGILVDRSSHIRGENGCTIVGCFRVGSISTKFSGLQFVASVNTEDLGVEADPDHSNQILPRWAPSRSRKFNIVQGEKNLESRAVEIESGFVHFQNCSFEGFDLAVMVDQYAVSRRGRNFGDAKACVLFTDCEFRDCKLCASVGLESHRGTVIFGRGCRFKNCLRASDGIGAVIFSECTVSDISKGAVVRKQSFALLDQVEASNLNVLIEESGGFSMAYRSKIKTAIGAGLVLTHPWSLAVHCSFHDCALGCKVQIRQIDHINRQAISLSDKKTVLNSNSELSTEIHLQDAPAHVLDCFFSGCGMAGIYMSDSLFGFVRCCEFEGNNSGIVFEENILSTISSCLSSTDKFGVVCKGANSKCAILKCVADRSVSSGFCVTNFGHSPGFFHCEAVECSTGFCLEHGSYSRLIDCEVRDSIEGYRASIGSEAVAYNCFAIRGQTGFLLADNGKWHKVTATNCMETGIRSFSNSKSEILNFECTGCKVGADFGGSCKANNGRITQAEIGLKLSSASGLAVVSQCEVKDCRTGVAAAIGGTLQNSQVLACHVGFQFLPSGFVSVKQCLASECKYGVDVKGNGTMVGSSVWKCGIGVSVSAGGDATIDSSQIKDCKVGVEVHNAGSCTIKKCAIVSSKTEGIILTGNCFSKFHSTSVTLSGGNGLELGCTGRSQFSKCIFHKNRGCGVNILPGCASSLVECRVSSNEGDGILVGSLSPASVRSCTVHNNAGTGIVWAAQGMESKMIFESNVISLNQCGGFRASKGAVGLVRACAFKLNKVAQLWVQHKSDITLESCAMITDERSQNDGPDLSSFYSGSPSPIASIASSLLDGAGLQQLGEELKDSKDIEHQPGGHAGAQDVFAAVLHILKRPLLRRNVDVGIGILADQSGGIHAHHCTFEGRKCFAGILCCDNSGVDVLDCQFENCSGIGICCLGGHSTITDCQFKSTGIAAIAFSGEDSVGTVSGCSFSQCCAGVDISMHANPDVRGCSFSDSFSNQSRSIANQLVPISAGILCHDNARGSVHKCSFFGGGCGIAAWEDATTSVNDSMFDGCEVGLVALQHSALECVNSSFLNGCTGEICVAFLLQNKTRLVNCTFKERPKRTIDSEETAFPKLAQTQKQKWAFILSIVQAISSHDTVSGGWLSCPNYRVVSAVSQNQSQQDLDCDPCIDGICVLSSFHGGGSLSTCCFDRNVVPKLSQTKSVETSLMAVWAENNAQTFFQSCEFTEFNSLAHPQLCITIDSELQFHQCSFTKCRQAIVLDSSGKQCQFIQCSFESNCEHSIHCTNSAKGLAKSCQFSEGQGCDVIITHDADPEINSCNFFRSSALVFSVQWSGVVSDHIIGAGIAVHTEGKGMVTESNFEWHHTAGLVAWGAGSPAVHGCKSVKNKQHGILMLAGASGEVHGAVCVDNNISGIACLGPGNCKFHRALIYHDTNCIADVQNSIRSNSADLLQDNNPDYASYKPLVSVLPTGLLAEDGGSCILEGCKLTGANMASCLASVRGGHPVVQGCDIDGKMQETAIHCFFAGGVTLDRCIVHGCQREGVRLQGSIGTQVLATTIKHCSSFGIWLSGSFDCSMSQSVVSECLGGGLFIEEGSVQADNCTFTNMRAKMVQFTLSKIRMAAGVIAKGRVSGEFTDCHMVSNALCGVVSEGGACIKYIRGTCTGHPVGSLVLARGACQVGLAHSENAIGMLCTPGAQGGLVNGKIAQSSMAAVFSFGTNACLVESSEIMFSRGVGVCILSSQSWQCSWESLSLLSGVSWRAGDASDFDFERIPFSMSQSSLLDDRFIPGYLDMMPGPVLLPSLNEGNGDGSSSINLPADIEGAFHVSRDIQKHAVVVKEEDLQSNSKERAHHTFQKRTCYEVLKTIRQWFKDTWLDPSELGAILPESKASPSNSTNGQGPEQHGGMSKLKTVFTGLRKVSKLRKLLERSKQHPLTIQAENPNSRKVVPELHSNAELSRLADMERRISIELGIATECRTAKIRSVSIRFDTSCTEESHSKRQTKNLCGVWICSAEVLLMHSWCSVGRHRGYSSLEHRSECVACIDPEVANILTAHSCIDTANCTKGPHTCAPVDTMIALSPMLIQLCELAWCSRFPASATEVPACRAKVRELVDDNFNITLKWRSSPSEKADMKLFKSKQIVWKTSMSTWLDGFLSLLGVEMCSKSFSMDQRVAQSFQDVGKPSSRSRANAHRNDAAAALLQITLEELQAYVSSGNQHLPKFVSIVEESGNANYLSRFQPTALVESIIVEKSAVGAAVLGALALTAGDCIGWRCSSAGSIIYGLSAVCGHYHTPKTVCSDWAQAAGHTRRKFTDEIRQGTSSGLAGSAVYGFGGFGGLEVGVGLRICPGACLLNAGASSIHCTTGVEIRSRNVSLGNCLIVNCRSGIVSFKSCSFGISNSLFIASSEWHPIGDDINQVVGIGTAIAPHPGSAAFVADGTIFCGFWQVGVLGSRRSLIRCSGCKFVAGRVGISVHDQSDCAIGRCAFDSMSGSCIECLPSSGVIIQSSGFSRCRTGIRVCKSSVAVIIACIFSHPRDAGISLESGCAGQIEDCAFLMSDSTGCQMCSSVSASVSGCLFLGGKGYGLHFQRCDDVSISQCRFLGFFGTAVYVSVAGTACILASNFSHCATAIECQNGSMCDIQLSSFQFCNHSVKALGASARLNRCNILCSKFELRGSSLDVRLSKFDSFTRTVSEKSMETQVSFCTHTLHRLLKTDDEMAVMSLCDADLKLIADTVVPHFFHGPCQAQILVFFSLNSTICLNACSLSVFGGLAQGRDPDSKLFLADCSITGGCLPLLLLSDGCTGSCSSCDIRDVPGGLADTMSGAKCVFSKCSIAFVGLQMPETQDQIQRRIASTAHDPYSILVSARCFSESRMLLDKCCMFEVSQMLACGGSIRVQDCGWTISDSVLKQVSKSRGDLHLTGLAEQDGSTFKFGDGGTQASFSQEFEAPKTAAEAAAEAASALILSLEGKGEIARATLQGFGLAMFARKGCRGLLDFVVIKRSSASAKRSGVSERGQQAAAGLIGSKLVEKEVSVTNTAA